MKKIHLSLVLITTIAVSAFGVTARMQVIHNSPISGLLSNFDAYVTVPNPTKILDDFSYREATPFLTVPAGIPFTIHLAPPTSTSIADTISGASLSIPALDTNQNYYLIAYGAPTPQFALVPDALLASPIPGEVALAFFHGGNDAPAVDIVARGVGILSDNLEFGNIDGYVVVSPLVYIADIFDSTSTTKVKSYFAPLTTATGAAALAFASGYLNPGTGQPAFGIFAALPNGTVIALPEIKAAFAQIIHNSADVNADTVDIYVKNNLTGSNYEIIKLDDVPFRYGIAPTPLEFIPSTNDSITVAVAPKSSTSIADAFFTKKFKLTPGNAYVLFANGILPSSTGYNPATPFNIYITNARFQSVQGVGFTDVKFFHGCTDAPNVVDIVETAPGSNTLADDLAYGQFSADYITVSHSNNYVVELRDQSGNINILGANFFMPLSLSPQANGAAIILFVTGFADPSNNNNGPALNLCAKGGSAGQALCFSPNILSVEDTKYVSNMILYPNPATTELNVEYLLESPQAVKMVVYNVAGQQVASVSKGVEPIGRGIATVDVSNLSKGLYFVNIMVGDKVNVTRSVIIE